MFQNLLHQMTIIFGICNLVVTCTWLSWTDKFWKGNTWHPENLCSCPSCFNLKLWRIGFGIFFTDTSFLWQRSSNVSIWENIRSCIIWLTHQQPSILIHWRDGKLGKLSRFSQFFIRRFCSAWGLGSRFSLLHLMMVRCWRQWKSVASISSHSSLNPCSWTSVSPM